MIELLESNEGGKSGSIVVEVRSASICILSTDVEAAELSGAAPSLGP